MRLPSDQNLSFRLCDLLADLFPESRQAGRIGLGQADDLTVWQHARSSGFILVSQDADFADLALLESHGAKVIRLRCGSRPTAFIAQLLRDRSDAILAFGNDNTVV